MKLIDLSSEAIEYIHQVAEIIVEGFQESAPDAWPTLESALAEVLLSFEEDRISRIALEEDQVLGWIGGIPEREGKVWELHPMVVRKNVQGKGIGRALIEDFELQVRNRGGFTIWLGTDDENGLTSLSNQNLYPNPLEHVAQIKNLKGHPYEFYQKVGFSICGVLPDANGIGKPDIFMAKRVSPIS